MKLPRDSSSTEKLPHDSLVGALIGICTTFLAVVTLIVGLRVYVRLWIVKNLGADDVTIIFATLCFIASSIITYFTLRDGMGRHSWDLPVYNVNVLRTLAKHNFASAYLYPTSATFTKISITISYLRIFPQPRFRNILWLGMLVIVSLWIAFTCITTFICGPYKDLWEKDYKSSNCTGLVRYNWAFISINVVTDFLLCTIPLPLVWKLHLPLRERVTLSILFGFGFIATGAALYRAVTIKEVIVDISYNCAKQYMLTLVECGLGIISASIPALKPIVKSTPLFRSRHTQRSSVTASSAPLESNRFSSVSTAVTSQPRGDQVTAQVSLDNNPVEKMLDHGRVSKEKHSCDEISIDIVESGRISSP